MGNNNLKSMASIAKERLKRGTYSNAERIKAKNEMNVNSYFVKNFNALKKLNSKAEFKTINNEIDDVCIGKVYSILSSAEDVYNPIGRLMDHALFSELSEIEKQFYILSLSDKYNKIKDSYFNEMQKIG